jgi:hypothetical protein
VARDYSKSGERDALAGFLDKQRDALLRKVSGVSEADARRTPTASALSLLSLLKHSALWEDRWFQCVVAGRALPGGWPDNESPVQDESFVLADGDTVEQWAARYEEAAQRSRETVAARELDQLCARADIIDCTVRYVVLHLIEETARHAGHADIIRETLDGSRGM